MSTARDMIATSPTALTVDAEALIRCIDACTQCAESCGACADACLAEEAVVHLRRCITLCANCSDVCHATGLVASRTTELDKGVLSIALEACGNVGEACERECRRHADMGMAHCRVCAEACGACAAACRDLLEVL